MRISWVNFFAFLFITLSGCWSSNGKDQTIHHDALKVLDENANIRPEIKKIMEALGHPNAPERVDLFVKKFFPLLAKKRNVKRWNLQDSCTAHNKKIIQGEFESLGFFDEIAPRKKEYDYFVVLGASINNIRIRLAYLKKVWETGVKAKRIVFLTGERGLEPFEGPEELANRLQTILPIRSTWHAPIEHPKYETELMHCLWLQAELPEALAKLPLDIVNTPEQVWPDGSIHRPNTGDTAVAWLKQNPRPGNCLVISTQPYVGYQGAVMRRWIKPPFKIETVGAGVKKTERENNRSVSVLIDSLIRQLLFESFHCKFFDEKTLEAYLKQ